MNEFNWSIKKNTSVQEDGIMEMSITPEMEDILRSVFEIEMLQGERWESQGLIHYKMQVSKEKAEAFAQAIMRVIFKITQVNCN